MSKAKTSAPLGIIGKYAAGSGDNSPQSRTAMRFFLQRGASQILGKHPLGACLKQVAFQRQNVTLLRKENGRVIYGNLVTCKRFWLCAVCASRISESRATEIRSILDKSKEMGYSTGMATYTLRHSSIMGCKEVLTGLKQARRYMLSQNPYKVAKRKAGIIGTITSTEFTWGYANGFHPHLHEIIIRDVRYSGQNIIPYTREVELLWQAALKKFGFDAASGIGYKYTDSDQRVNDYVTKFGRTTPTWDFASELTKHTVKRAKGSNWTMTDLLIAAVVGDDHKARALWLEYAKATEGIRAIVFSNGLRRDFGLLEKSDSELLEDDETDASPLYIITLEQWKRLLRRDDWGQARAELLIEAEKGVPEIEAFLRRLNVIA